MTNLLSRITLKQAARILAGLFTIAVLSFLYVKAQTFDHVQHNRIVANVSLFKQLDATLNQDVIKTRSYLLRNYDPLVHNLDRLNILARDFIEGPAKIYHRGQSGIDERVDTLMRMLEEKENLVERYKSENAVLNNSLRYLPVVTDELIKTTHTDNGNPNLPAMFTTLLADVHIYNLKPSEELRTKVKNDLTLLVDEARGLPAEIGSSINTLASHVRTIIVKKNEVDKLLDGIISMPSGQAADNLFNTYQTYAQENLRIATVYRFYLYLFSIVLLAYVTYILFRLRQTAEALAHDIIVRKQTEAALFAEKERALVTLGSIGDAVITANISGNVEYLNPVAESLTGWSSAEAEGLPLAQVFRIVNETTRKPVNDPVDLVLGSGQMVGRSDHTVLISRDGAEFAIEDSAAPIFDREGNITGVVLVFHDVSDSRKLAAQLSHQATHDALTGLINRREFEIRLERALASTSKHNNPLNLDKPHALLYVDLDQFKIVNDTCGHIAGDELLRRITSLLQTRVRDKDTLARLGGDEFGVLLERCPPETAARIAEDLRQMVGDFCFLWQDKAFTVGASIGLVSFNNDNLSLTEILSAADTACYIAKDKGRNRVHAYYPEDRDLVLRHGEMEWLSRIRKALDENRFCLYAQNIVSVKRQNEIITCHELLLRMIDEQGNLISPMAFIPAAERYNLMTAIDHWVVRTAFGHYARQRPLQALRPVSKDNLENAEHKPVNPPHTWIINLSGSSIGDENFLQFIREQFIHFAVPHHVICFEITETAAITNLTKAIHFMTELKALGCRFSLDDFGSGLSSFAYLKHLPVDFLKIDGGFVRDMAHDPIDHAMVEAINNVGHIMNIQTIAESVENDEILELLKKMGVDFAQGYGISEPKPFYEVTPGTFQMEDPVSNYGL